MILKIKDMAKGWWIYGEIEKCHYHNVSKEENRISLYDLTLMDKSIKNDKCVALIIRFRNEKEFTIQLDESNIIYLCNDEGKTIERIVI